MKHSLLNIFIPLLAVVSYAIRKQYWWPLALHVIRAFTLTFNRYPCPYPLMATRALTHALILTFLDTLTLTLGLSWLPLALSLHVPFPLPLHETTTLTFVRAAVVMELIVIVNELLL